MRRGDLGGANLGLFTPLSSPPGRGVSWLGKIANRNTRLVGEIEIRRSFKSDNAPPWLVCKLYRFGKLARGNNRSNVAHLNRARYLKQR